MAKKIIKTTKYCNILEQGGIRDGKYEYCIERIYVKSKKQEEIRFSVYKDTCRGDNRYVPRSLDVTELELIDLIKLSVKAGVFSQGFINRIKKELSND